MSRIHKIYPSDMVDTFFLKLGKLSDWNAIHAIREGMIWLLPCLLLHSFLLTIAFVIKLFSVFPEASRIFFILNSDISKLIPMLLSGSIGYVLAIRKGLPSLPVALIFPAYTYQAQTLLHANDINPHDFMLLLGIVIPLIAIHPLSYLYNQSWSQLSKNNLAGYAVKCSINLITPCVLVSIALTIVMQSLLYLLDSVDFQTSFGIKDFLDHPHETGVFYVLLNSILWFIGIHGGNTLQLLMTHLDEAALQASVFMPNSAFLSSFVFIGGSGSTLSLVLAALLACKNKTIRLLAFASFPIGIFNVNELLLFGLPIMLNPRLFIPFICTPLANFFISYLAIESQLLHVVTDKFDLTVPVGLNAYLASGMNLSAVSLQFFNIIIGTFIYYPFIKYIDRNSVAKKIVLKSLNTTYSQLHEQAALYIYNPLQQVHLLRYKQTEQERNIFKLSKMEFYLEYQPNISPFTGKFLGCEALIRARDETGAAVYPNNFLPLLEDAKLMRSVDLWVAQTATNQYKTWREMEMDIPFTINITADTLSNEKAFSELINCISTANGRISIEITEQSFVDSLERIAEVAHEIHAIGAKIYIDDFGTGYSSLAHLYKYDFDCLKIDRSFVLALDNEKGRKIMHLVFKLAESLNVDIVVEGVESLEQLEMLPSNQKYGVQGWIYSKALPGHKIPEYYLKRHRAYNQESESVLLS